MKSPNLGGDSPKLIKAATLRTLFENNPLYHFTLLPIEAILARKSRYLKTKYFFGKKQMWHFFSDFHILCFFFFVVQVQRRGLLWPVEKKNHRWKGLWAAKWHFFSSAPLSFFSCLPHQLSRRWKASSAFCPFYQTKRPFLSRNVVDVVGLGSSYLSH